MSSPPPPPLPGPERPRVMDEERGRTPDEKPPIMFVTLMNMINTITHLVLGAVTVMAVYLANTIATQEDGNNSLKQHIYLCVIGYILLMSQAILSFNPQNGWTQNLKFPEKRVIHWVMQVTGSVLAIAGSVIRIREVSTHWSSAHAVLGMLAMIFTILSLIGGLTNLFVSMLGMKHGVFKVMHATMGVLTITIAYLSLCFGFNHSVYRTYAGDTNTTIAMVFTIAALFGTLTSAMINIFRRIFCCC